jgi:hypothetical protein
MPFCSNCGAAIAGAYCSNCGTPSDAREEQPPAASAAAPVARRTSPIVWVLVVILGFFVLCGLGAAGIGYLVVHRAHQAGVSFDRTHGGFAITGRDGRVEFGNAAGHVPSWIPSYPGSKPAFSVRALGRSGLDGSEGEGGEFNFTTHDAASQVFAFYQRKCQEMAMSVNVSAINDEGGTLIATDDADRRSLTIVVGGRPGLTTVMVTYGRK